MRDIDYASVNTTVRVLESQLLTKEQFDNLLRAPSYEAAVRQLAQSPYQFSADKTTEHVLMTHLLETYQLLLEQIPDRRVIQIFSLKYTYHNLKVLLKERFVGREMTDLIIFVGNYELSALRTLVQTGENAALPQLMQEEVQSAIQYYEDYQRLEVIDLFMDNAYLRHLREIASTLNDETITSMVDAAIDLFNLSSLMRGRRKDKSRSFFHLITSHAGAIPVDEVIEDVLAERFDEVFKRYQAMPYARYLAPHLSQDAAWIEQPLERIRDTVIMAHLEQATLESFGPLPLLAYICALEAETRHLRLILGGKQNLLPEAVLRERMGPIYGA